ncbi:hypothetical protein [Providencia rettgeri]|uniref:hypothetical protein n=1 Tax=Providencia rettgeri TaxID=587 RepID=UPI0034E09B27
MTTHLTNIPHPIIGNLNQLPFDKKVKTDLVNQRLKLTQPSDSLKQIKQINRTGSKVPIRLPTLKHAYSEPSNIDQKNILRAPILTRACSEPSNLSRFCQVPVKKGGLARRQPNYQTSQVPRSLQYIQKAKDDKIAAYHSLPDIVKNFLKEKLSHKILVTVEKGPDGKEAKKFMVVYEEFKQNINKIEKEKYRQAKLNGLTQENRFQLTKTVWNELDKLKRIQTQEEIDRIVASAKWCHLNR